MKVLGLVTILAAGLGMLATATVARAHWDVGDPHKMHSPQLPDPNGWDVNTDYSFVFVADDWRCAKTGPVSDIHIWFSYKTDVVTPIFPVSVSILSDVPAGPGNAFSHPGSVVWSRDFVGGQVRLYGTGDQGFYDPAAFPDPLVLPHDHLNIWQLNLEDIADPWEQQEGTIYWLEISMSHAMGPEARAGWKTSLSQNLDVAVWRDQFRPYAMLVDPVTGDGLDMAFVITPEPATLTFVALGLAGLVARRRRK